MPDSSTLISLDDAAAWTAALARMPDHDIYHTAEWHAAFEGLEGRRSYAYAAEAGGERLFHPFHLRPIDGGGADIETVYSYSGPLATSADPDFLAAAWAGLDDWSRAQGAICEFFRFNPFLDNTRFAPPGMTVSLDRQTVWLALDEGPEALWSGYEQTQRGRVRKAERNGLVCEERPFASDPLAFAAFYRSAMAEVGAADSYFFPDEHFTRLAAIFGERAREFRVLDAEGALLASAMFLTWGDRFHYHLAATPRETRAACPTNLLLHRAALWAMERGLKVMHLGGGRTADPADDLLAFKRQFSRRRADFSIGRRVLDRPAYDALCGAWLEGHEGPRPAHFQLYRLPRRAA